MKNILFVALIVFNNALYSQKQLPRTINTSSENEYFPMVSADDRNLIFVRKYEMGSVYTVQESQQINNGVWNRTTEIELFRAISDLIYYPGFSLSADGNTLYFSCRKSPGIGRFDIWYIEKQNGVWNSPQNYYKPLNSEGNDVCPSVSSDGEKMYYIKGNKEENGIISGDIYVSEKKGTSWGVGQKITGSNINTGNETRPIILPDNETLIFASNRVGGKGGFDLYISRIENGQWSEPKNIDFLNTKGDDFEFTVPARGDLAYFSKQHDEHSIDIFMTKIPEEFQPKKVTLLQGKVLSENAPIESNIYIFDAETNAQIGRKTTDKEGNYFISLTEGKVYDVCIYPNNPKYGFHSTLIEAKNQERSERKVENIEIITISSGKTMALNNISFEENSTNLTTYSAGELNRLVRVLLGNKDKNILLKNYFQVIELESENTEKESIGIRQAAVIRDFLVQKGIATEQIKIEEIPSSNQKIEIYFE